MSNDGNGVETETPAVTRAGQAPPLAQSAPQNDSEEVTTLVRMAIDKGVPVEVLERLVALQERVTVRNARAAFFAALTSFQDACPEINKSKTAKITMRNGGQYTYSFAPLEEITRTIRPVLIKHGLSYSWDVESSDAKSLKIACVLRHVDGHEERSTFPVPTESRAEMSEAQKNGAALTYGRRQSLIAVLGLTTADQDIDGADLEQGAEDLITEKEAADLDDLMESVGANRTRFLEWLKVSTVAEVPKSKLPAAIAALEEKRKRAE